MYSTTLCFLIRDNEILLGMKKTGFGQGKYNGFGGKIKQGETVLQATVRELEEESGILVEEEQLEHVGILDFIFPASPQLRHDVHIFLARSWQGEPLETEEMRPQWFLHSAIPYAQMWQDDIFWLPKVLAGETIKGSVVFAENNEDLSEINI
ncbi:MAG: hydrolase [Pelosinus sp.]|jgi:8-oxo-dGTP pyrophosphatase MutT (NUDIX family)|nr:hydrolase [Pelosinus sp.]